MAESGPPERPFGEARYPARVPIEAYGNGGFRFAGMSHRGSILALPGGMMAWPVTEPSGISVEMLGPLLEEAAGISILLVGTGAAFVPLPSETRRALAQAGLSPDIMATGAAVRTYNVLVAEQRAVAAALIAVDAPR
jgi:uncharacterized protein